MDKGISEAWTVNALQHYYEKQETETRTCLFGMDICGKIATFAKQQTVTSNVSRLN